MKMLGARRVWFVVLGIAAVCACTNPKTKAFSEHSAKGAATLAQLVKVGSQPLPPLTEDGITLVPILKGAFYTSGNAAFGPQASWAQSAQFVSNTLFPMEFTVSEVASWLKAGGPPRYGNLKAIEDHFAGMERIKFVVVIRQVRYQKPEVKGAAFVPGLFEGEAHVFDLGGAHHGGVRFQAASSPTVDYTKYLDGKSKQQTGDNAVSSLEIDLLKNASAALNAKLAQLMPGSMTSP